MRVLLMNDKTRVHQNAVNPNPWHLANVGSSQSQGGRVKGVPHPLLPQLPNCVRHRRVVEVTGEDHWMGTLGHLLAQDVALLGTRLRRLGHQAQQPQPFLTAGPIFHRGIICVAEVQTLKVHVEHPHHARRRPQVGLKHPAAPCVLGEHPRFPIHHGQRRHQRRPRLVGPLKQPSARRGPREAGVLQDRFSIFGKLLQTPHGLLTRVQPRGQVPTRGVPSQPVELIEAPNVEREDTPSVVIRDFACPEAQ